LGDFEKKSLLSMETLKRNPHLRGPAIKKKKRSVTILRKETWWEEGTLIRGKSFKNFTAETDDGEISCPISEGMRKQRRAVAPMGKMWHLQEGGT